MLLLHEAASARAMVRLEAHGIVIGIVGARPRELLAEILTALLSLLPGGSEKRHTLLVALCPMCGSLSVSHYSLSYRSRQLHARRNIVAVKLRRHLQQRPLDRTSGPHGGLCLHCKHSHHFTFINPSDSVGTKARRCLPKCWPLDAVSVMRRPSLDCAERAGERSYTTGRVCARKRYVLSLRRKG